MDLWTETLVENESDHAETIRNESCACGVALCDHYGILGAWKPCANIEAA